MESIGRQKDMCNTLKDNITRNKQIDFVRGVAILIVVIGHVFQTTINEEDVFRCHCCFL